MGSVYCSVLAIQYLSRWIYPTEPACSLEVQSFLDLGSLTGALSFFWIEADMFSQQGEIVVL
ncbi:hypothetical protein BC939DRAFT_452074 [Gamsiella multidivaricata]|uniref:uncharacterized protein n=1 Tax=Gamsiella multidivaricata TaxID=101098 RepID=UPI00221F09A9|nr:uncharacterized protein BC939DRAFT_452074 [Gamsiella multidivaricata]KAI7823188.1 hypothetical protein BC939DRAFT_452074 [Gamsiella multidivaricata]